MIKRSVSEFRAQSGQDWNSVVFEHAIGAVSKRGARGGALFIGFKDARELVASLSFNPERTEGGGDVSLWLPELAVHGVGDTDELAREDLLETVRDYVELYLDDPAFRESPNRGPQFAHVMKAWLSDQGGELEAALFERLPSQSRLAHVTEPA